MRVLTGLFLILIVSGCGEPRIATYPVSGRVQFSDREPVRTGTIELESRDHGTTATGTIREDGTFVLGTYESDDGATAGKHRVIVVQIIIDDGITQHSKNHGRAVPPKFNDYSSSGLLTLIEELPENKILVELPFEKK